MRTDQVIAVSPDIQATLALLQIRKGDVLEQFLLQGSVKAFLFSLGLGMIGAAMQDQNAQTDQPDRQSAPFHPWIAAPPRPGIIAQNGFWQAILAENPLQLTLDGAASFICTSSQADTEAGMVIQHR